MSTCTKNDAEEVPHSSDLVGHENLKESSTPEALENHVTVPKTEEEEGVSNKLVFHSGEAKNLTQNIQNLDPNKNVNSDYSDDIFTNSTTTGANNGSDCNITNTLTNNIELENNLEVTQENKVVSNNLEQITKQNIDIDNNSIKTSLPSKEINDVNKEEYSESSSTDYSEGKSINEAKFETTNVLKQATSTISLNDDLSAERIHLNACLSKSVDNISISDTIREKSEKKLDIDTIDQNEILTEYKLQKAKAAATQKIVTEPLDHHIRIPKEILTQDLGSIVKNVHGIFSSVSGSLKNAYNISHNKVAQRSTPKVPLKSLPNSKIISEIFEGSPSDNVEANLDTNNQDNGDKTHDTDSEVTKTQAEVLEQLVEEQKREIISLREQLNKQHLEISQKELLYKENDNKMDIMRKRVEQAEREKDSIVMKYAGREQAVILAQAAAETAARAERAAAAEVELLNGKLKSAHNEKQRICQLYDDKSHEAAKWEREAARAREELREVEGRYKWAQSKLRTEVEAYKDSAAKVEKLQHQVTELETALSEATSGAADSARAKLLETDLKESQASLILCRHERAELERKCGNVVAALDTCVRERDDAALALARANDEVSQLREDNARLGAEAAELASLRATAAIADSLASQLDRCKEALSLAQSEAERERERALASGRREARALEHAAALQEQHAAHSATHADTHAQVQALSADNAALRERVTQLEEECARAQRAVTDEAERRRSESRALAGKVAELTAELEEMSKKLEWESGENGVLKKKHASAVKELNRELQRALKRCDQLEAKLPQHEAECSRTGSVSSLSSGEMAPPAKLVNGHASDSTPEVQAREPDKQTLIERIVSLQRALARRSERCEFLEEHSRQLTLDCRNKARLLRQLLCSLAPQQDSDPQKRDIVRLSGAGGGTMAALWGGDLDGLTPQLSTEMIRRLQASLEDALLKNIMLKENIDTLGKEIARLKPTNEAASTSQ